MIRRRAVIGWVLYDLANTIFSMGVVSLYFSLYVRDAVGAAAGRQRLRRHHRRVDGDHLHRVAAARRDDRPRAAAHAVPRRQHAGLLRAAPPCSPAGPSPCRPSSSSWPTRPTRPACSSTTRCSPEVTTEENRGPDRRHRRRRRLPGVVHRGRRGLAARARRTTRCYFTIVAALFLVFARAVLAVRAGARQPESAARSSASRMIAREHAPDPRHAAPGAASTPACCGSCVGRVFYTDADQHGDRVHVALHDQRGDRDGPRRRRRPPPGRVHHAVGDQLRRRRRVRVGLGGGPARPEAHARHRAPALDGGLRAGRRAIGLPPSAHRVPLRGRRRWPASHWAALERRPAATCCA